MEMSNGQNLQQIWDFRRRDDDINSSSDNSKSSSKDKPIYENKQVSEVVVLEKVEVNYIQKSQHNSQLKTGKGIKPRSSRSSTKRAGLARKNSIKKSKTKRTSSPKQGTKKKRKSNTLNRVLLDDLKIFSESILQDLKVESEKMFVRMKEDLEKLAAGKSMKAPTRKKNGVCVSKTQNGNNGAPLPFHAENCHEVLKEQVNHDQATQTIRLNGKEKGDGSGLSAKKPLYSSNNFGKRVPSSYLTLPSVLSEPHVQDHRVESSSRNNIQQRENLVIESMNPHGCFNFSGVQAKQQLRSVNQVGSKNIICYGQNSAQASGMGNGVPLPFHPRLDNTLNIPSQILQENASRGNNLYGVRLNGGVVRLSENGQTFSNDLATYNFCSHMNNGELGRHGSQTLKDGRFY